MTLAGLNVNVTHNVYKFYQQITITLNSKTQISRARHRTMSLMLQVLTFLRVAQKHSTFPHVMSAQSIAYVTTTQRNLTICK